jgi:hypothetical protein
MDTIDPEEGEFFEGVLLETCRDDRVTRPRVRPVEILPEWLRVEFPRHLTRFRADVHVRRKHHAGGRPNGDVYLRAENASILRVEEPDAEQVLMARQKPGSISGRSYEYILISRAPTSAAKIFSDLAASKCGPHRRTDCSGYAVKNPVAEPVPKEMTHPEKELAKSSPFIPDGAVPQVPCNIFLGCSR